MQSFIVCNCQIIFFSKYIFVTAYAIKNSLVSLRLCQILNHMNRSNFIFPSLQELVLYCFHYFVTISKAVASINM